MSSMLTTADTVMLKKVVNASIKEIKSIRQIAEEIVFIEIKDSAILYPQTKVYMYKKFVNFPPTTSSILSPEVKFIAEVAPIIQPNTAKNRIDIVAK